jgi:succinate dehydrogenase/fumarate reductase cytochrome b subunit
VSSGLRIIGLVAIPRRIPRWFGVLHRASGALAVALAVPVAYDCVAAFGYQLRTTRIALHGAAGIVLFAAFTTKVIAVQRRHHPSWLVPAAGVTLVVALAALWLTSLGWPVSVY